MYEADDTKPSRKVTIRRFFCARSDTSFERWVSEFKEIAQSLCHLNNPYMVQVLDAGVDDDGASLRFPAN